MRKVLLVSALAAALPAAAHATAVYVLTQSNTAGVGAGPYAEATVNLVNSTTATVTFDRLGSYSLTDVGLNVNATNFSVTGLSFTQLPGDTQTTSYTPCINCSGGQGQLDGFGNLTLVESANPSGFSAANTEVTFTLHDLSGTWANDLAVLTPNASGNFAAAHTFTSTGQSFFSAGNSGCDIGPGCNPPPPPPPPPGIPEPSALLLLGTGLIGLSAARKLISS